MLVRWLAADRRHLRSRWATGAEVVEIPGSRGESCAGVGFVLIT